MAVKKSTVSALASKDLEPVMFGFKGTDKDLRCRDFQFAPGTWHEHDGETQLCNSGFHFCENPLEVFGHYPPATNRFHTVEARGVADATDGDSKRVSRSIKIGAEIGIAGIAKAFVEYRMARVKPAEGAGIARGVGELATSSGYASAATSSGYASAATVTGNESKATANDPKAIAHADGINSRARGQLGAWLTISERVRDPKTYAWDRIAVHAVRVDGTTIKADTCYTALSGKVVEVDCG